MSGEPDAGRPGADGGGDVRTQAERRYRRWLALYPRRWREPHGEALLGTWLDAADADGRDRPTRAEVADLVVHGLAERARVVLPAPAALRTTGLVALGFGAALSVAALVLGELMPPFREFGHFYWDLPGKVGSFSTSGPFLYVPFVGAAVLALAGLVRAARVVLVLTALVAVVLLPVSGLVSVNAPPVGYVVALGWCAVLAAAGVHRARAVAVLATAVGVVVLAGAMLWVGVPFLRGRAADVVLQDQPDRYTWLPFYRGEAGLAVADVVQVVVVVGLVLAVAGGLALRRWFPVVAFLLVLPGGVAALAFYHRSNEELVVGVLAVPLALALEYLPRLGRLPTRI